MGVMERIQNDDLAVSVATALALANEAASGAGVDPQTALITISQEKATVGRNWRIHYGPRDYINRRGGDVTVFVDEAAGRIQRVLKGQ
ncbi:MAG: hypothetical protein HY040_17315 [Planctomycetes bacterium]|nr:hypothetical protein [Planctomycetota bacterium]